MQSDDEEALLQEVVWHTDYFNISKEKSKLNAYNINLSSNPSLIITGFADEY